MLTYTNGQLDRAVEFYKNPEWLAKQLKSSKTKIVPIWNDCNLIDEKNNNSNPSAVICTGEIAQNLISLSSETVFLGIKNNSAFFSVDLSKHKKSNLTKIFEKGEFSDLRQIGPFLSLPEASILAYARGILYWHQNSRYCGKCSSLTESRLAGHMRKCSNSDCRIEFFPKIAPAVIMLIKQNSSNGNPAKCLLARNKNWPRGSYSILAGFVDLAESLEETVEREVFEEVGLKVSNIKYIASQPWPFPSSLMLGFTAEAITTYIKIDEEEIEDARWFTAEELLKFGEWNDNTNGFKLSRKDSISRYLIDTWIEDNSLSK